MRASPSPSTARTTAIDLSKQNAANLRKALHEYETHGRRVDSQRVAAKNGRPQTSSAPRLAEARQWAGEHGFEVSSRGRVPGQVLRAYEDVHK